MSSKKSKPTKLSLEAELKSQIEESLEAGRLTKINVYRDLVNRLRKGERLTPAEMNVFRSLEKELKDEGGDIGAASVSIDESFIVNTKTLARFFRVTTRNCQLWAKRGCPRIRQGVWDLRAVLEWWLDNIWESRAEKSDESFLVHRRRLMRAKADREEDKRDFERGLLWKREESAQAWARRMAEVVNGLQILEMRLPPLVEGKEQKELRAIIGEEIYRLRENFCRTGRFCPPPEEEI